MTEKDLIIQNLRRENEVLRKRAQWISVKDKLPCPEEEVLVFTKSKNGSTNIDKGYLAANLGHFVHRGSSQVTHWMPLPDAPKEG